MLERTLIDAIKKEDIYLVSYLLRDLKADPNNILPKYGLAPIHYACGIGSEYFAIQAVSVCIECGGDVNLLSLEKMTPVLISAFWGRSELLKFLLSNGGDPWRNDSEGKDAFEYAEERNHSECLAVLEYFAKSVYNSSKTEDDSNTKGESSRERTEDQTFITSVEETLNPRTPSYLDAIAKHVSNMHVYESDGNESIISGKPIPKGFQRMSSFFSDIDTDLSGDEFYASTARNSLESKVNDVQNTDLINLGILLSDDGNFSFSDISETARDDELIDLNKFISDKSPSVLPRYCSQNGLCGMKAKSNSIISLVSDHVYRDTIENVALIERHFKPDCPFCPRINNEPSCEDIVNSSSGSSDHATCTTSTVDTDVLRSKLKGLGCIDVAITKTTKKVYVRFLKRNLNKRREISPTDFEPSEMLSRAIGEDSESYLQKWTHLEETMRNSFNEGPDNQSKTFFNYLLLDPRETRDLPLVQKNDDHLNSWKIFVKSIFYVGKGKNSRPYQHFNEAVNCDKGSPSQKVLKIRDIWAACKGVVCLHMFNSISSPEAFTREAAMIDAINIKNLTNQKCGNYYGVASRWSMKDKTRLGSVLLHRAFRIYMAEGERQLFPTDII